MEENIVAFLHNMVLSWKLPFCNCPDELTYTVHNKHSTQFLAQDCRFLSCHNPPPYFLSYVSTPLQHLIHLLCKPETIMNVFFDSAGNHCPPGLCSSKLRTEKTKCPHGSSYIKCICMFYTLFLIKYNERICKKNIILSIIVALLSFLSGIMYM